MATRYVETDRSTPMLLPPEVREWVGADDITHLILKACQSCDLSAARVNLRGTGDAQYPPSMMLALLIYSYSVGRFSSRAIERSTHDSSAVRDLCAHHHPDHDTIARFRRENAALLKSAFVRVLELAREVGVLRLGAVSVDGTKIAARAGKTGSRTRAQLEAETRRLEGEVDALVAQAEACDARTPEDGTSLPKQLASRERRLDLLAEARRRLDERQKQAQELNPRHQPKAGDAVHPVEPDSAILPTAQGPFIQGYNAQAAVSAEGTTLIVGVNVVTATNDRRELVSTIDAIAPELGRPAIVVADAGYDSGEKIEELEARGIKVYCPPQKVGATPPRGKKRRHIWAQGQRRREELDRPEARKIYGHRARSSEPTFHVIKRLMGFGRFMLRGLEKVNVEWILVAVAYNCRKLAAAMV